ncbi:hypothetical protein R3P38DRAFT_2632538 [Favolaschia claudopus]|uniref:F-box domain-containing protein n=1 Tax=Favolaschia claudopus TaxID=2862362 RepID=A0AAW0B193_9AGAR
MGQYWKLVNLDKSESLVGHWGKLGEFLFDGRSLDSLAVCLEICDKPPRDVIVHPYKPGDLINSGEPSIKLRLPQRAVQRSDTLSLINLPVELICEVFSYLRKFDHVLCLATTCQAFWEIGRSTLYHRVMEIFMPCRPNWVGCRIICVGDYLKNEDIPENLLTPSQRDKFIAHRDRRDSEEEPTLYNYPYRQVTSSLFSLVCPLARFFERCGWDKIHIIHHLLHEPPLPPPPSSWPILRNLSRRIYVRYEALLDLKEAYEPHKNIFADVYFGEVLVTRICLSSDPSTSTPYEGPLHRGDWVGDRFDVVYISEEELDDGTWSDVSSEVLKVVEDIWRAEYGVQDDEVPRFYSDS